MIAHQDAACAMLMAARRLTDEDTAHIDSSPRLVVHPSHPASLQARLAAATAWCDVPGAEAHLVAAKGVAVVKARAMKSMAVAAVHYDRPDDAVKHARKVRSKHHKISVLTAVIDALGEGGHVAHAHALLHAAKPEQKERLSPHAFRWGDGPDQPDAPLGMRLGRALHAGDETEIVQAYIAAKEGFDLAWPTLLAGGHHAAIARLIQAQPRLNRDSLDAIRALAQHGYDDIAATTTTEVTVLAALRGCMAGDHSTDSLTLPADPARVALAVALGHADRGDVDAARQFVQTATPHASAWADVMEAITSALVREGDLDEALMTARAIPAMGCASWRSRARLATCTALARAGRIDDAMAELTSDHSATYGRPNDLAHTAIATVRGGWDFEL